jgi:hypothetical protein
MSSRAAKEELLTQLQATHATLRAALVQVGASMLKVKNELEEEAAAGIDEEDVFVCPSCGRPEGPGGPCPAGTDGEGNPEYVCACLGPAFTVKRGGP